MLSKSVLVVLAVFVAACAIPTLAVDKSKAIGPCLNGWCPPNSYCVEEECYPNEPKFYSPSRRFGKQNRKSESAIGPCIGGRCPNGFTCANEECVQSVKTTGGGKNETSIGPCVNNLCPNGFTCSMEDYKCYP